MRPIDPRLTARTGAVRGFIAGRVLSGTANALLLITQATLMADVISEVFLGHTSTRRIVAPLVWFAVVSLARGALVWADEALAVRTASGVKSVLRRDVLARLAADGPNAARRHGESALLATRGVDALDGYFARYLPQLVLAVVVPFVVGIRILTSDWISALIIALTVQLVPLFMMLIGLATRAHTDRQWRALTHLSGHFLELVAGLPTLVSFGRARSQAAVVARAAGEHRRASLRTLRVAFLSSLALELLSTLSVALVAVSIGLRLVNGGLDLRTGLLVLILAPEVYLPLRQVGARYHEAAEGMAAVDDVFAILDAPPVPRGPEDGDRPGRAPAPDPSLVPVVLERVTAGHPDRESVLDEASARIAPGRITGVAGPSGAGKSTLLGLVLGLVPPSIGRLTVGGADLADLAPAAWRARVAWVPQRPHLFAGTVAENIRLGDRRATPEAVERAAHDAGLDLDLGTAVGAGGAALSGGQRRRVALARALLRDAPLLVLDEPTEGLDARTEADVARVLRRLTPRHTILLVAHRPALLAVCDIVLRLDEGHLVQDHPLLRGERTS